MDIKIYLYENHRDKEKPIRASDLGKIFQMEASQVRREINALRAMGVPICSSHYGYYYATNREDIEATIEQISNRIKKIESARDGLEGALNEFEGGKTHE